jgi:quinol monooxygenase YgiN
VSDLRVVAIIPVKPESAPAMRAAISSLGEATRDEEGCLGYDVFESAAEPGVFVTVESWRSQSDLDAHLQTEHVRAAVAAAQEHLVGDIAVHPLVPVD